MPRPERYVARDGVTTWRVRFRLGHKQTSETFLNEPAAKVFCRELVEFGATEAVARLEETLSGHGDVTLADLATKFLEWKAVRVRSDRTVADYRRDYTRWIAPTLGHRHAVNITEADVQRWVDAMIAGLDGKPPASPKSISDRHALLHSILAHGLRLKVLSANVATGTDLPRKQKPMPKGLRPAEWSALHTCLLNVDRDYADVADALLATGWRWSEVAGMACYQVEDLPQGVWVSMEQVMRRNAASQNVIVAEGKGQASVRRVRVDDTAAAMFLRRIAGKGPGEPVFTTKNGAPLNYNNFMRDGWNPAVKAAGLARRPTPHWLRHTHVFWMALTGASLPELQSRIGHESITTTIGVYGRALTDVSPAALDGFARLRDSQPAATAALAVKPVREIAG